MAEEKNDRKKLWDLYGRIRKAKQAGTEESVLNAAVQKATQNMAQPLDGVPALLEQLGIEQPLGETSLREKIQGGAAQVAQGATLGFADEIGGALAAAIPGGRGYTEQRDRIRGRTERFRQEQGGLAAGGLELAGGMIPAAVTGPMALARGGARTGASLLSRIATTGGRMGAVGGLEGAAYGVGAGEGGLQDRAAGGLLGGALGGVAGGVLGAGGVVGGQLARKASSAVPALRNRAMDRAASNAVGGILDETGRTPQDLVGAMRQLPRTTTSTPVLADADRVLMRYARAAKNLGREMEREGGVVERIVDERALHAGERIVDSARRNAKLPYVGEPDEVAKIAKRAWRQKFLRPIQAQVGDEPIGSMRIRGILKQHPVIEEFLGDPELARQGQKYRFADAWDTVDRMQAKIGSASTPPNEKERLIAAAAALKGLLRDEVPQFGRAMDVYSGIMRRFDAYKLGDRMAGRRKRTLRAAWESMEDDTERLAFRQGLMDNLEGRLENYTGGRGGVGGYLTRGGEAARSKLRVLFDTDEAYNRFVNSLEGEKRFSMLARALSGNSTTPQQLADMQALGGVVTRGPSLLNELISIVVEDPAMQEEVATRVGRLLLEAGPEEALEALFNAAGKPGFAGRLTSPATLGTSAAGLLGGEAGREARGSRIGLLQE